MVTRVDLSQAARAGLDEAYDLWRGGQGVLFLDVRKPEDYERGHIPGARSVPLLEVAPESARLPKDAHVFLY